MSLVSLSIQCIFDFWFLGKALESKFICPIRELRKVLESRSSSDSKLVGSSASSVHLLVLGPIPCLDSLVSNCASCYTKLGLISNSGLRDDINSKVLIKFQRYFIIRYAATIQQDLHYPLTECTNTLSPNNKVCSNSEVTSFRTSSRISKIT